MKYLIIFVFVFIMAHCNAIFATPSAVQNNALRFVNDTWGKATIDEGTVYYGRDGDPAVYCFTVALGIETELSSQAILDQVEKNRKGRQAAEETLRSAIAEEDQEKAAYARSLVNQEWAKMRDEGHFATVYMSGNEEKTEPLQYYQGLPLHLCGHCRCTRNRGKPVEWSC